MDFLKTIPKPLLVSGVLVVAAVLIMLNEPPTNVCDAQLEVFMKSQAGRLNSLRGRVNSLWVRTAKQCKETKTLGGCLEFHETVKSALVDIDHAPVECTDRLVSQDWLSKILTDSLILMVKNAWGENVPEPGPFVYGWMTPNELAIFCRLQTHLQRNMDDEDWDVFVRRTILKLPHAKELKFDDSYWRSFFSVRCEAVL